MGGGFGGLNFRSWIATTSEARSSLVMRQLVTSSANDHSRECNVEDDEKNLLNLTVRTRRNISWSEKQKKL